RCTKKKPSLLLPCFVQTNICITRHLSLAYGQNQFIRQTRIVILHQIRLPGKAGGDQITVPCHINNIAHPASDLARLQCLSKLQSHSIWFSVLGHPEYPEKAPPQDAHPRPLPTAPHDASPFL